MIETLKGMALIDTFIGVLITFAMWISLWDSHSACRRSSFW